jgi:hypothetical protein
MMNFKQSDVIYSRQRYIRTTSTVIHSPHGERLLASWGLAARALQSTWTLLVQSPLRDT